MSDIEDEYELTFDISLAKQRSSLPIFLGGLVLGLFILALLLTFIHLRNYSAVTELTEPGKDGSVHEYLIVFTTSLLPGSGMIGDGKVSVKLIGSFSDSEFFTLHQRMIEQNILARGHTDIFVIHTPVDLGDIRRMILTITNWSSGTLLTWRPCFLKIIKSDNFQCWGTSIKDILACETNIQYTFDLIKDNENEELSLWKMIILYHPWTSPFNHPQRFGAYTNTANGIFFFFTQSTLLITTLITFISSQIFTENMDSNFDISLVVSSAAITTSLLQILELFLRSIRPSDELSRGESWQGLWIPEFYKNPNYINIDFDWDKAVSHPSGVVDEPINIFTSLKMPTLEFSSGSHHDSNSSSSSNSSEQEYEEEAYVVAMDLTPDLIEHCLLSVLHQISGIKTRYFSAANEKESILKYHPIFIGKNSLEGVKVKMLDVVRTSQNCQFCIWMDNPYMGRSLHTYCRNLVKYIKIMLHSISICSDHLLKKQLLIIFLHHMVGSVCERLMFESFKTLMVQSDNLLDLEFLFNTIVRLNQSKLYDFITSVKQTSVADHQALISIYQATASKYQAPAPNYRANVYFAMLRSVRGWRSALQKKSQLHNIGNIWKDEKQIQRYDFSIDIRDVDGKEPLNGNISDEDTLSNSGINSLQDDSMVNNNNNRFEEQKRSKKYMTFTDKYPNNLRNYNNSKSPFDVQAEEVHVQMHEEPLSSQSSGLMSVCNLQISLQQQQASLANERQPQDHCHHEDHTLHTLFVSTFRKFPQCYCNQISVASYPTPHPIHLLGKLQKQDEPELRSESATLFRPLREHSSYTSENKLLSPSDVSFVGKECISDTAPIAEEECKCQRCADEQEYLSMPLSFNSITNDNSQTPSVQKTEVRVCNRTKKFYRKNYNCAENVKLPVSSVNSFQSTSVNQNEFYLNIDDGNQSISTRSDSEKDLFTYDGAAHVEEMMKNRCCTYLIEELFSGQVSENKEAISSASARDSSLDDMFFSTCHLGFPLASGISMHSDQAHKVCKIRENINVLPPSDVSPILKTNPINSSLIGEISHFCQNTPMDDTTHFCQNTPVDDTIHFSQNTPVDDATHFCQNTPGDYTTHFSQNTPVDDTTHFSQNTPADDTTHFCQNTPVDDTTMQRPDASCFTVSSDFNAQLKISQPKSSAGHWSLKTLEGVYRDSAVSASVCLQCHQQLNKSIPCSFMPESTKHKLHSADCPCWWENIQFEQRQRSTGCSHFGNWQKTCKDLLFTDLSYINRNVDDLSEGNTNNSSDVVDKIVKSKSNKDSSRKHPFDTSRINSDHRKRKLFHSKDKRKVKNLHRGVKDVPQFLNPVALELLFDSYKACTKPAVFLLTSSLDENIYCCEQETCQTNAVVFTQVGTHALVILRRIVLRVCAMIEMHHNTYNQTDTVKHKKQDWIDIAKDLEKVILKEVNVYVTWRNKFHKMVFNMPWHQHSDEQLERAVQEKILVPKKLKQSKFGWGKKKREIPFHLRPFHISLPNTQPFTICQSVTWPKSNKSLKEDEIQRVAHELSSSLITISEHEINGEAYILMALRTCIAHVVNIASMEAFQEMKNPTVLLMQKFRRAQIVKLFHDLLPYAVDDEDNIYIKANNIRKQCSNLGRLRVHVNVDQVLSHSFDLDLIEAVADQLDVRWSISLENNSYEDTLEFLSQCLTLDNLNMPGLKSEQIAALKDVKGPATLIMDCLSHIKNLQFEVKTEISKAAEQVLTGLVEKAIDSVTFVEHFISDEKEKVNYICEMIAVLEDRLMNHFANVLTAKASEVVQNALIRKAALKAKIKNHENAIMSKMQEKQKRLQSHATGYACEDIKDLKTDLKGLQQFVNKVRFRWRIINQTEIIRFLNKTLKRKETQTQRSLLSLASSQFMADADSDHTLRELMEVEWIVTGEIHKMFSARWMRPIILLLALCTLISLTVVMLLSANLSPSLVGRWFVLHLATVFICAIFIEPIKLLWYWNWEFDYKDLITEREHRSGSTIT